MLQAHFDQIEHELLTLARRPSAAGHSFHKGTPRESFIKNYLQGHLSSLLAIGNGEVIDATSIPGDSRPQMDIVVYKRQFPKIDLGGGVNAFFIESVVATIEVKSTLTKNELRKAMKAAFKVKALCRDEASAWTIGPGYKAPGILCFLISYDGPVQMGTVRKWVRELDAELGVRYPPLGITLNDRLKVVAPAIDGIFILGKGIVIHDSLPISLITDDQRAQRPDLRWITAETERGSLLLFFCVLTTAGCGLVIHGFNALAYLKNALLDVKTFLSDP
jgi:hypothetical protein